MVSVYFCFLLVTREPKLMERKREWKKGGALCIETRLNFGMLLVLWQSQHIQDLFLRAVQLRTHIHAHVCSLKVGKVRFFFNISVFLQLVAICPCFRFSSAPHPPKKIVFKMKTVFFKDSPAICCQLASESLLSRTIVIFLRLFRVPQKLDLDFFHFWPSGKREMSFHGE